MRSLARLSHHCIVLAALLSPLLATCPARAMQPLGDAALAAVQGRDGMSFDLSNFSMSGDARFTYYAPAPSTASAWIGNLYASRSDDTTQPFGDPYRLDVNKSTTGQADIINLNFPVNANGLAKWQVAYDWGVNADGINFDGGSLVAMNAAFYGGGRQWTTPRSGDGIAFGLALRTDIGNLLLRPRGRDDITQAEPSSVTEQLNLRGIHLGAVDANGNFTNQPWKVADVTTQPGIMNAVTDSNGQPRLHFGIDWPDANGAATGGLVVDNISFRSNVTGNLDLGSSRIGSMQIQYLDIKVRP
jgi:hypothetical protein